MAIQETNTHSQSTQQSTQSTQEPSQSTPGRISIVDGDIWGSLIPLNMNTRTGATRIDFLKSHLTYTIGRSRDNDVSFPKAMMMSQRHCSIQWDGEETSASSIIVMDKSSNGTFIKGVKIGKNRHRLLQDWSIISFGPYSEDDPEKASKDYRFFFRHMASSQRPNQGVYACYDVKEVIGTGAFAKVVKALHNVEGKFYAIKMFQGEKLREMLSQTSPRGVELDATKKHLEREFQILQRLQHRNICQLKEAFLEEFDVSVVLELAEGGDLLRYVLKREVLLEPEAQGITYQICDALAYVHKRGIVHRDLKPENVLLTDDHPPVVKVADFGLARVIDSLSKLQTKCGTPAFVAPEVLDPHSVGYDQIVDSWSLGVMVYMMLTSRSPFHDDSQSEPDWALLQEYNISEDGEDFIRCLLEYNPQRRMTPAQGMHHPWLAVQKHCAELATAAERAQTSAVSTLRGTPTPPNLELARAGPSTGAKRKAIDVTRSMSSLLIDDKQRPAKKKTRGAQCGFALPDIPASHFSPPARFLRMYDGDSDEIPGLGLLPP